MPDDYWADKRQHDRRKRALMPRCDRCGRRYPIARDQQGEHICNDCDAAEDFDRQYDFDLGIHEPGPE